MVTMNEPGAASHARAVHYGDFSVVRKGRTEMGDDGDGGEEGNLGGGQGSAQTPHIECSELP